MSKPPRRTIKYPAAPHELLIGVGALILIALTGFVFARRSQAEFEVPIVDTANYAAAKLTGLFAYARSDQWLSGSTIYAGPYEYTEAFAVGENKEPSALSSERGVIYRYDGSQWQRVKPTVAGGLPEKLYDIVGQYDFAAGYAPIWVVGAQGKMWYNQNFDLGPDYNLNVHQANYEPVVTKGCGGSGPVPTDDLYAIAAAPGYRFPKLAGGKNGVLMEQVASTGGNDPWQQIGGSGCPIFGANEHIVDIAYGPNAIAYLVTITTASANFLPPEDCPSGATSKLYRLNEMTLTPLGAPSNRCFYGLDVVRTTNRPNDPQGGHLRNAIWIAASNGVYLYDEGALVPSIVGPQPGTGGTQPLYGISAVERRGGRTVNLLPNGDFEAWNSPNPSGNLVNPSTWLVTDEGAGRNNNLAPGFDNGVCDTDGDGNPDTNAKDIRIESVTKAQGNYALRVEPGISYSNLAACSASNNQIKDRYFGATGRVDLSNIEGARFKVSGQYRVEFDSALNAPNAQGGVSIGCGGPLGWPHNCSFSVRREIVTKSAAVSCPSFSAYPNCTLGEFHTFEFIISNQNLQYARPILGGTANPRLSRSGMVLQVNCEATYGARVWCDNLRVEVVDSPISANPNGYQRVEVTAAGKDGKIYTNSDALGTANFSPVANQAQDVNSHLYAADNVQGQFTFAAGEKTILLTESPSNLNGFIWAGTASPGSTGQAALGWISTSCSNTRDSQGRTLCQRFPNGYGLVLDLATSTKTLRGRAWFGKSVTGSNSEKETVNLGNCQNPARQSSAPEPYNMTGSCDTTTTRTCRANSSKSCLSDFDCFGRCLHDQGFVCLTDGDCQVGIQTTPPNVTNSVFSGGTAPVYRLQCDESGASPGACAGAGWLTFNPADFVGTPPASIIQCGNGGSFIGDPVPRRLQGCGQFMTLANPNDPNNPAIVGSARGWVSLRGPPTSPNPASIDGTDNKLFGCRGCSGINPGQQTCRFCQDQVGRSCTPKAESCAYHCGGDPSKLACISDAGCPAPSVCQPVGRCSANGDIACSKDDDCIELKLGFCNLGAVCNPETGPGASGSCNEYGVNYDIDTRALSGYAWSPDYGWLSFRNIQHGTTRFIRTQLGDIHTQGQLGGFTTQPAPSNRCNATYFLTARNGINNFCSNFSASGIVSFQNARVGVDLPPASPGNLFENAVGRFDIVGLETNVGGGLNKYGMNVSGIADPDDTLGSLEDAGNSLLGGVYILGSPGVPGDFVWDRETRVIDGAKASVHPSNNRIVPGNGLVVANGNLRVSANINYASSGIPITDVRQVASLVVVVKGDLMISPAVTKLAGTYFVTGDICTASSSGPTCDASIITPGTNRSPLEVRGLMFAKHFHFKRQFAGTVDDPRPSELIINDGRAQTNPLPGMVDFVSILPNTILSGP